jgi:hypothetical protein
MKTTTWYVITNLFWSVLLFGIIMFLWTRAAHALPLELQWDAVTTNANGSPLSAPVKYRLYRKTTLEDFKPIAETSNRSWTWLTPSLGKTSYYVTAFNENGESEPSNVVHVNTERWPHEDFTIPTPTPAPDQSMLLKVIGKGPLDE